MKVYGDFVEPQGRAWVLVETGFGLGKKLAGGGQPLAFLGGTLLICCGALGLDRDGGQAHSDDEQCRQDGDGSAAAAPVAADAGRQEVPGARAQLNAVGDHDPTSK